MEKTFTLKTESVYQVRATLTGKIADLYGYLDDNTKIRAAYIAKDPEFVHTEAYDAMIVEAIRIKNKINKYKEMYEGLGDLLQEMHALGE
jgi:hypothetical protein